MTNFAGTSQGVNDKIEAKGKDIKYKAAQVGAELCLQQLVQDLVSGTP